MTSSVASRCPQHPTSRHEYHVKAKEPTTLIKEGAKGTATECSDPDPQLLYAKPVLASSPVKHKHMGMIHIQKK
jgi:hypothetical protein